MSTCFRRPCIHVACNAISNLNVHAHCYDAPAIQSNHLHFKQQLDHLIDDEKIKSPMLHS